jgi:FMN phosphatase YigB (HAD superfamily)
MNLPNQPGIEGKPERTRVIPEGLRVQETIDRVTARAAETLGDTPLLPETGEVTAEDADRVERFLLDAFPPDGENYRTHGHLQLTAAFAAELARRLGRSDADAFYALGLLHDVGRLLTHPEGVNPHRYHRNDRLGDALMRRLRVPQSLRAHLQPAASYTHPERYPDADAFTPEQQILMLADICGKRRDDGSVQPFGDTIAYHYASRGKLPGTETPWSSQRRGQAVVNADVVDQWGKIYEQMAARFRGAHGIDVEEVRADIERREASSPVDTVVFDVGGVLIPDSDPATITDMAETFHVSEDAVLEALAIAVPPHQTGRTDEDGFWRAMEESLGQPLTAEQRVTLVRRFIPDVHPEMRVLLEELRGAGVRLGALSDTVPAHAQALRDAGAYDAFSQVCLSPDIHCSKKAGSAHQPNSPLAAFRVAALRMRRSPQACVFIDDKQAYADAATRAGMRSIVYTSPADVRKALEAAGLRF